MRIQVLFANMRLFLDRPSLSPRNDPRKSQSTRNVRIYADAHEWL